MIPQTPNSWIPAYNDTNTAMGDTPIFLPMRRGSSISRRKIHTTYSAPQINVMLPDEDGYQILGRLRETAATRTVPVIMVTAKTSEIDVVKGLDHGADDYLCKPFGIMEFISRVKAVLRRASTAPASTTTLRFGDITLDDVARTVTVDGEPVELTFKEYSLLHFFLEHPEEVLARERIMKAVWDTDDLLESRTIDMHVRTLRQKLGHAGDAICTVRKVGYKLSAKGTEAGEDA